MSKLIGDQPVKQIAGGMAAAEEAMKRDQAEKAEKAQKHFQFDVTE